MDTITPETIQTILDLGSFGFSIYALVIVWRAKQDLEKRKDEIIEEKDKLMQENRQQVLDVVKDNTRIQSELRSSIKESTKATETLTSQLYRLFDSKNNKS